MYILLIGSDARSDSYIVGLADSIRVVRVDFVEPGVRSLVFPRDLYVEIPEIADHYGITHGKLNQAFLYGNSGLGYYDGEGQGPGLLSLTLEHNFGIATEHYVAVNLQTFVRMVDAVGGIDIVLPFEVDGRVKGSRDSSRYFPAGLQRLNGYRTMLLARMRPDGDIQRSKVQNLIMDALIKKLLSPDVFKHLPEFVDSFDGSVQTDLGPIEAGQLICLASMLDSGDFEFISFPDNLFKSTRVQDPILGNTSIIGADFELLRSYVQDFMKGIPLEDKNNSDD